MSRHDRLAGATLRVGLRDATTVTLSGSVLVAIALLRTAPAETSPLVKYIAQRAVVAVLNPVASLVWYPSGECDMGRTLLLTGRPGVGKTTVIQAVVRVLGERADGFYTEEIRQSGGRLGFQLTTLRDERTTLAHVRLKGGGRPYVGRYGVDVSALDRLGVAALERAVTHGRIVVIDEIGKMELFSEAFMSAVLLAMDAQTPVIATVMARPYPWVDVLKARPDVLLWRVTIENRDIMPSRVLDWLCQQV